MLPGRVLPDEAFTEDALRASLRQRYPLVHIALRGGRAGVPQAEAPRQARLSLLGGGAPAAGDAGRRGLAGMSLGATTFAHPDFWAPFILAGNWL